MDTETVWIVNRIFGLANAGMGTHKIAKTFREEQVPCPSWWLHSRGKKYYSKWFEKPENKYEWLHTIIRNIIANPLYLGHLVMCMTKSIFKANAVKKVSESERIWVDNPHETLVTQELFDGANAKIESRRRDTTDTTRACKMWCLRQGIRSAVLGKGQKPHLRLHCLCLRYQNLHRTAFITRIYTKRSCVLNSTNYRFIKNFFAVTFHGHLYGIITIKFEWKWQDETHFSC